MPVALRPHDLAQHLATHPDVDILPVPFRSTQSPGDRKLALSRRPPRRRLLPSGFWADDHTAVSLVESLRPVVVRRRSTGYYSFCHKSVIVGVESRRVSES